MLAGDKLINAGAGAPQGAEVANWIRAVFCAIVISRVSVKSKFLHATHNRVVRLRSDND